VQARLASSRLPGKVLYPAPDGRPLLAVLLERVARAERVDEVRLAIPDTPLDRSLMGMWAFSGLHVGRWCGSEDDVLERFVRATDDLLVDDLIVRLTGDNPLVDPQTIDRLVWIRQAAPGFEYAQTGDTYPEGLDVEVFSRGLLLKAHTQATLPSDREHVTPWMRRTLPALAQLQMQLPEPMGHLRVTVDDATDYAVVCDVLERIGPTGTFDALLALARKQPQVFAPNAGTERNAWKRQAQREVEEAQHG
jgi:spore coat polysaccharide biosynthesis protein SpsF (cytidylyltransferase family)